MKPFDFKKFEGNQARFLAGLKAVCQQNLFKDTAPDLNFSMQIVEKRGGWGKKIEVQTEDFAAEMNFQMFDKIYLHNFGGGVIDDSNKYWLPLDWRWMHFDGGSNGTRALTLYVSDTGRITSEQGT